jgi:hypothetical protein
MINIWLIDVYPYLSISLYDEYHIINHGYILMIYYIMDDIMDKHGDH